MRDAIAWSCGGGIQSVALGVLIREGVLPVPQLAGIADTSREVSSTWRYLDSVLNPYMSAVGVKIERIPHDLARVDLCDRHGTTLMPAYTERGRLGSFCSGEWKRDVMMRWLRSKGVESCTQWLGFSFDERHRESNPRAQWCQLAFPLIEMKITRHGCEELIKKAGLPLPKKSRCWCCPHQNADEWREVKANTDEWKAAVFVDQHIRDMDPEETGLFLHKSRVPLPLVEFGKPEDDVPPLFRDCQEAGCWT